LTYENVIEIILGRQVEDEFDQEREDQKNKRLNYPQIANLSTSYSAIGARPTNTSNQLGLPRSYSSNTAADYSFTKQDRPTISKQGSTVIDMKKFHKNLLDNLQNENDVEKIHDERR